MVNAATIVVNVQATLSILWITHSHAHSVMSEKTISKFQFHLIWNTSMTAIGFKNLFHREHFCYRYFCRQKIFLNSFLKSCQQLDPHLNIWQFYCNFAVPHFLRNVFDVNRTSFFCVKATCVFLRKSILINNSLHLAWKCARIFVRGLYGACFSKVPKSFRTPKAVAVSNFMIHRGGNWQKQSAKYHGMCLRSLWVFPLLTC